MHPRHVLLTFGIIAIMWGRPFAQQPYFQEESFSSPALAIKHVTGIASDRNNCIWFATQTGIYRYDGARFRHYSVLNTLTLKFERMSNIALRHNRSGDSWCFTDSKGNLYEVDSLSRIRSFVAKKDEQIV